jgi:hypothetical protein
MPVSTEGKSSKSERLNPAPYVRIMQLIDEKYPSMFAMLVKLENNMEVYSMRTWR